MSRHLDRVAMEVLLQRWVNLPDSPDLESRAEVLVKEYPEIFEELRPLAGDGIFKSVVGIRDHLRALWNAPTDREREWYCFRLRQLYAQHLAATKTQGVVAALKKMRNASLAQLEAHQRAFHREFELAATTIFREIRFWGIHVDAAPPPNHFDRLIYTLQRLGPLARHCENVNCPRPYFFASRSSQRFCSNACAVPAQREAKLRWWGRHRDEQLKKRRRRAQGSTQQNKQRRKT
ncbi:MAG: hypothetical protein L0338_19225 [Acidobacteria bacterium]|nr:hypothetical protein [Acidobacteriota bacterium]